MRLRIAGLPADAATPHGPAAPATTRLRLASAIAIAAVVAGCSYSVVVGTPTPDPTQTNTRPGIATEIPLEPTPWPNGTLGKYGLRIDPSLLSNIPSVVGGNALVEDVVTESAALDDPQYAQAFSAYYAAHIGFITDANFVQVGIAALKVDAQTDAFYTEWRNDWFQAVCSQADGVGSTAAERINDWPVDDATCKGGVRAYTVNLGNGILLSIVDVGPRRLGRELIQGIN